MKKNKKYDFCGYATKANVVCSDGRIIDPNAFSHQDGTIVPLVWKHLHDDIDNNIGHIVLEHRPDGMYGYASLNDTPMGSRAKNMIVHGDISALSIHADQLVHQQSRVMSGRIREVSLVNIGANPGAFIDDITITHDNEGGNEAIMYNNETIEFKDTLTHSDDNDVGNMTVNDFLENIDDDKASAIAAIIDGSADIIDEEDEDDGVYDDDGNPVYVDEDGDLFYLDENGDPIYYEDEEMEHSFGGRMKYNIFENSNGSYGDTLTHEEQNSLFKETMDDAQASRGSFKESFLLHAANYGISNIEDLFPDPKMLKQIPDFIKRETDWVSKVLSAVNHTPFTVLKTMHADITADDARAKGYVKASRKKDEVFKLLKRTTQPTTIYKKQKLDRDDMIDITSFDIVVWLKEEMNLMLREEMAGAILVSDGRETTNDDKINEDNIRPIYNDDELYAPKYDVSSMSPEKILETMSRAKADYRGSGSPTLFTTTKFLNDLLWIKDTTGRRIYETRETIANLIGVKEIVEVPVMERATRIENDNKVETLAIIVNLADYSLGANKSGQETFFDDFDIDYNQYKYLIETRRSGALTKIRSALVFTAKSDKGDKTAPNYVKPKNSLPTFTTGEGGTPVGA